MYTMYANASNNITSYTYINLEVKWRVQPLGAYDTMGLVPNLEFMWINTMTSNFS